MAPAFDRCLVVAEDIAEDRVVVGAEAVRQTERLFRGAAERDAGTRNLERPDQRLGNRREIIPVAQLRIMFDTILGYDGVARLCPPSWLRKTESYDEVRRLVQRVLEFPANRLLLTHGGPTDPSAFEA